ncbi:MAG: EamA family transporter [Candidatus Omnitrophota bacterium]|nr:EamA family transporter [Candidatus Omnitrophota bacterium]MBU1929660.1 EamA family transporter [Candidatus Omnitrophota bacterium]MBU2035384.1 EamA family transporter [Candidatus Omnitrophota bacterium]MBU2221199.1 EamA family transporter [Candidatus Omnitrophota bacterium]MBU2257511.1 EamA family transporter [Candidatus Omnitrophota bacterium]
MKKNLTLKILFLLIFSDILETFTHYCFKRSVIGEINFQITSLSDCLAFAQSALASPFLWAALLSILLTFIIWSSILSRIDLSVAVLVASFSYIFVPLVALIFLHEKISFLRWGGILFILMGVILASLSTKEKAIKQ